MTNFLFFLLKANIGLLVFYSLYILCFRQFTFFTVNRIYLLLSFPVAFLLIGINIPVTAPFELVPARGSVFLEEEFSSFSNDPEIYHGREFESTTLSILPLMEIGYLVGVFGLLFRLLYRLFRIRTLIRSGRRSEGSGIVFVESEASQQIASFFHFVFCS